MCFHIIVLVDYSNFLKSVATPMVPVSYIAKANLRLPKGAMISLKILSPIKIALSKIFSRL